MNVEFYILEFAEENKVLLFICQLIEKKFAQQKIYLHTNSKEQAKKLDQLLWVYKDISFLPHCLSDDIDPDAPITIGYRGQTLPRVEMIINLDDTISHFDCGEIVEIVSNDASAQQAGRERYRQYRQQGMTINTYKMPTAVLTEITP